MSTMNLHAGDCSHANLIQNNPAIEKVCSSQEVYCEKRCGYDGRLMTKANGKNFDNDNSGEFSTSLPNCCY